MHFVDGGIEREYAVFGRSCGDTGLNHEQTQQERGTDGGVEGLAGKPVSNRLHRIGAALLLRAFCCRNYVRTGACPRATVWSSDQIRSDRFEPPQPPRLRVWYGRSTGNIGVLGLCLRHYLLITTYNCHPRRVILLSAVPGSIKRGSGFDTNRRFHSLFSYPFVYTLRR